jgi:nicotinamidase/pyrazinamidase
MTTVFFDVDTQFDFLYPAGSLYVAGAERVVAGIELLNQYAAAHGILLISTVDAHAEDDPEFRQWPPHCIAGTLGQHKPAGTLLDNRVVIPNRDQPVSLAGVQQIVLEKQTVDAFATATLPRVLEAIGEARFVVYGVVSEICVLNAARGLLKAGFPVTIVSDAVKELSAADATRAFEGLRSQGVSLTTISSVTSEPRT